MPLHDEPREALRHIVATYGEDVVGDPRRSRALLLDFAGAYRTEVFVLVTAQEEGIARDLVEQSHGISLNVRTAQLTQRLVENRAMAADAAAWAVSSWAWALGLLETPPRNSTLAQGTVGTVAAAAPATIQDCAGPERRAVPSAGHAPRTERRGGLRNGVYESNWATVEVFGRPRSESGADWLALGRTPGAVTVPLDHVVRMRASVGPSDLPAWIDELGGARDVVALELRQGVTDNAVEALRGLPRLRGLTLDRAQALTDAGLGHLSTLQQLSDLDLAWVTGVSDSGFSHLGHLAGLETLALDWCAVGDDGLRGLARMSMLARLSLQHCHRVTGSGLSALRPLFRLRGLTLAGLQALSNEGVATLRFLTSLRRLSLSRCPRLGTTALATLAPLASLRHLDLSWNVTLGDDAVAALAPLGELETLNLGHLAITNGALSVLKGMRTLRHLDLTGCVGITDRGVAPLRQLKGLVYLNLTGCTGVSARAARRLQRPGLYIVTDLA